MSCSKFLLIEGLNTASRGIDNSLSTDTTDLSTRSKGEAILTNFTDNPEKIGRNKNRRRSKITADAGNKDPQYQETEEDYQEPQDDETGDTDTVTHTLEMYLPNLDNTPLSQALKSGLDWGMEDKVIVECLKLKQYFGVDTLLIKRVSGTSPLAHQ